MQFIVIRTCYSFDANLGLNIFEQTSKQIRISLSIIKLASNLPLMHI